VTAPRRTLLAVAFVLFAAPPALAAPEGPVSTPAPEPGSTWVRPAHACGTEQIDRSDRVGAPSAPLAAGGGAQRTIYLNRFGGTYSINSSPTNSATNVANRLVSGDGQSHTAVIPPLASGFNWTTISNCVRQHYAPYNVRVVETEPTSGAYIEAVVGGTGTEIGFGANELFGIAAADDFCGVTETGIAFSFSETHRDVPRRDEELCATIAHEIGHLVALEHETLAIDLMSYVLIQQSGTKTFANQSSSCGTQPGQPQGCSCGGSTTNSAGRLTNFLGLRPIETEPPTMTLVSPGDDADLPPTFEVVVRASDNMAMEGVSVLLNGVEASNDFEPDGDEYHIMLAGVADGAYTLAAVARDQAGNEARAEIAVTISRHATGESCGAATDCTGGVCAMSSDGLFCTENCDPANDTCPDGFSCNEAAAVCAPVGDGGCCSTGSEPTGAMGLLILGVGLVIVRRRRRV
jgi:MYXO-CTERM domain-containing protein